MPLHQSTPSGTQKACRLLEGLKFPRQFPVGKYIADFCCIEKRLVIEIDGGSHVGKEEYDRKRTVFLEEQGFHVIRFTNKMVYDQLDAVIEEIRLAAGRL
jgi:very-short-patch-repair endonuclease